MRKPYKQITVRLASAGTVDCWREAARALGFTIARGPLAGLGNVSTLLNAVASGEVKGLELEVALAEARDASVADVGPGD